MSAAKRDRLRREYDFSSGVRGKYLGRFRSKAVFSAALDPDVARAFPDAAAVNEALRTLMRLQAARPARRTRRKTA